MIEITVCVGSSCHLKGSSQVIDTLLKLIEENKLTDKVTVKASFCMDRCQGPVCVKVNNGEIISLNKEDTKSFFKKFVIESIK